MRLARSFCCPRIRFKNGLKKYGLGSFFHSGERKP